MINWILDPEIYGMPNYGLVAGQSRTFAPYLGDKGSNRYSAYNLTGPIPVTVTYNWRGDVLAQFRQAWEDRTKLAFGGTWFRITLPVDFARGDRGTNEYDAHFVNPFSVSLAGFDWWSVTMALDVDTSPALGTIVTPPPPIATIPDAPTAPMWTLELVVEPPPGTTAPEAPVDAMWTLEQV